MTGGLLTGLTLWESCIIPFLLNNASSWVQLKKKDMDKLSKLQNYFLNTLLNTFNCPIPIMYLDLDILSIQSRILKEKLLFFHHICSLPQESLAYQVLKVQKQYHFPSLYDDISHFLIEHEIVDVKNYSKAEWKTFVKMKVKEADRNFFLESSKKYKKLDHASLALEEEGIKDYFLNLDVAGARIRFKERSLCMSYCKSHYSLAEENLLSMFCSFCPQEEYVENLSHWRRCLGYSQFPRSRDLSIEADLISYYQDIIQFRKMELDSNV